ncbi:MAG: DNA topoisomerase IB, partial [Planctomycetes bacterium]|nr:DNA topoisomerase IB [Planctomycetota bacterium]
NDLRKRGLPHRKVVAAAIDLLDRTLIRVGHREYAEENGSFGLTTLRDRHVEIDGSEIRLRFSAKGGKDCETTLRSRRLARVIEDCEEVPGRNLFQYEDESGQYQTIRPADISEYLQEATGQRFTAKDFRTWRGTAIAAGLLRIALEHGRIRKKTIREAIRQTAEALGNTASVCRKFYVNPQIFEFFESPDIVDSLQRFRPRRRSALDEDEQLLAYLLRRASQCG